MRKTRKICRLIPAILFFAVFHLSLAQNITVSGHLYEKGSRESLPGGLVYDPSSQMAATTNTYGFYTLTLPYHDSLFVVFNSFGFVNDTLWVKAPHDIEHDAFLSKINTLQTVNITAEKQNTEQVQMSSVKLSVKDIKNVPMLFGEKDVFKTLLLLPGVQSASEGTSGIYVRGGGPDQNIILLDEATIYNASHLLGFFSIFNGDAIKSVELIKGGFPARYGGRLSSVVDITMKDGNRENFHVEGGVGIISSNVMVEGPVVKDKASFMLSGRTTYLDIFMVPIMKLVNDGLGAGYYFFDLNAKMNFDFAQRTPVYTDGSGRTSSIVAQDTMAVEHKLDYGIAGGLGLEFSHPRLGHFLLEGRYYYGLGNIYGNTKRDYFAISNFANIVVKLTYLFDITRTKNPKIK